MKTMTAITTAMALLVLTRSAVAHHSLSKFDTETAVTVKGVIVRFERVNPHSVIVVDQTIGDGQVQRWAVEGPSSLQLVRMGIEKDALKPGDIVEACGYVMKERVEPQRTVVPTLDSTPAGEAASGKRMSGQALTAEVIVMPDGRRRAWSDYGHHKCLGPEYVDFHVR